MTAPASRVAVVIPAYNEAASVREIAAKALAHVSLVIVVDDGSVDETTRQLDGLPLVLLRNCVNQGKAASLCRGFEHALDQDVDAIISLDADGQHRPEDIPRLLEASARAPDHVIIGARLHNRDETPGVRRFGQFMADFWIGWAAGRRIRDTQSGYRLYPGALLRELDLSHGPRRSFLFESEVLVEATQRRFGVAWIGIDAIYGSSQRQSHYRAWGDTWAIVVMVAGKLLRQGLNPIGLLRVLGVLPHPGLPGSRDPDRRRQ